MGRVRRSQRQSARVYYEGHDHREIILNGEYINAVYVPSEQYYMDKDVAWRKYKKLTLLASADFDDEQLVSVDVYNKFVSFGRGGYVWSNNTYLLGDEKVACGYCMSINGYDYKYFDTDGDTPMRYDNYYRFAKKYFYEYEYNSSTFEHTLKWYGMNWNKGSQYATMSQVGTVSMTDTERIANLAICGESRDGLFANRTWTVRIGTQYPYSYHHYIEVYHIDSSGFHLVYSDDYVDSSSGMSRLYPTNIYSHGNVYCGVTWWNNSDTVGVRLWVSNNGLTWIDHDLINDVRAMGIGFVAVVYRNDTWYFYIQRSYSYALYKWELYTVTDLTDEDTYQKVVLPDYLDIPMLGYDDGIHGDIDDCEGEYVRIRLNTYDGNIPAEQGTTYYLSLNSGMYQNGYYDSRFFSINDGHMHYDPPNTFYYAYSTEYDFDADDYFFYFFYIDNMTFQSSSNNIAFRKQQPEDAWLQENHEYVADDDYVWGNNNA